LNLTWTRPTDIVAFIERQWARGRLLVDEDVFPLRVPLKGPTSSQLSDSFSQVQSWISELRSQEGLYRIEWRSVRHRLLGSNLIPAKIWVDRVEQAVSMLGRESARVTFQSILSATEAACPDLLPWVRRKPLRALEMASDWRLILDVVGWIQKNPQSGLYIRQVDFPGVHTKFIETHKSVLADMLSSIYPESSFDHQSSVFERRFGFRERPSRVRFRFLDLSTQLPPEFTDISLSSQEFAQFVPTLRRVFITENEINYLVFPPCPDSLVIFGAGYSIHQLAQAEWLRDREIYYWGDIDTHGFAILDQLRAHFPQVRSLLMDQATFLAHREHWVSEKSPTHRSLTRLTSEEQSLYWMLCNQELGTNLRLEQEIVRYPWVLDSLRSLWVGTADLSNREGKMC
jgi:hypothetical protein